MSRWFQEQLRHKQAFNILAFGSAVSAWRDALTAVSEKTLRHAWHWLRELDCFGSTNTLAALRQALGDPQTQAVYLLTDGRPNQVGRSGGRWAQVGTGTHRWGQALGDPQTQAVYLLTDGRPNQVGRGGDM